MRTPTASEARLLGLLLGAVFLALNMVALRAWSHANASLKAALGSAQTEASEHQAWIVAAESIGGEFDSLPPLPTLGEKGASSSLLGLLRDAAQANGLTIIEESLPPPPEGLPEKAVVARMKLSGPFAGLVKLLFAIQQPEAWRSVEQLILKADATPQNVLAEMEVRQYFNELAPEKGSEPAPES